MSRGDQDQEKIASCPKCKTFETLLFVGGRLVPTVKFTQVNGDVYHDCGAEAPCHLFPIFKRVRKEGRRWRHNSS